MRKSVLLKSLLALALVLISGSVWGQTWEKVDINDLTADDIFVIVAKKGTDYYAMSNDGGTQNPPSAVSVTMTEGIITSNVEDRIKWNLESNSSGRYTFLVNGSTTKWLYCTNSNNGVRVGTGSNKVFTVNEDGY